MSEGGTTPSLGAIAGAVEAAAGSGTKVNVLIRPRAGDFCYMPREVHAMVRDIAVARSLGADGVVVGALTPSGSVDFDSLRLFVDAAKRPIPRGPLGAARLGDDNGLRNVWVWREGLHAPWSEALPPVSVTFHRAFDVSSPECEANNAAERVATTDLADAVDVEAMLAALADAGVDRLLTSGMAPTAWEGRHLIQRIQVK